MYGRWVVASRDRGKGAAAKSSGIEFFKSDLLWGSRNLSGAPPVCSLDAPFTATLLLLPGPGTVIVDSEFGVYDISRKKEGRLDRPMA